jgi:hypothetical protein
MAKNTEQKILKKEHVFLKDPELHDYPAAQDYLELLFSPQEAKKLVTALKKAPTIIKKAKDIFRASELPLLPKENRHVQHNLKKFKDDKKLSPLLLVRGKDKLIIADGYHRMCASYYLTEDLEIPCRLV